MMLCDEFGKAVKYPGASQYAQHGDHLAEAHACPDARSTKRVTASSFTHQQSGATYQRVLDRRPQGSA